MADEDLTQGKIIFSVRKMNEGGFPFSGMMFDDDPNEKKKNARLKKKTKSGGFQSFGK